MTSRKNALLTTEDRRWLLGKKVYDGKHAKQQRYQRRRDIRDRVSNSIRDFSILFDRLEEDERRKIFGDPRTVAYEGFEDKELERGTRDALAFLLYNSGITQTIELGEDRGEQLFVIQLLTDAIRQASAADDIVIDHVDIEIEGTHTSTSRLVERLETDEQLSPDELYLLLQTEEIDTGAVQECMRSSLREDS